MRIGVVSDTHNNLKNVARIVEIFNRAEVARVIHTGDITQAKTLDVLANLDAPLLGVFGNNDLEQEQLEAACAHHGFDFVHGIRRLELAERRVTIVHDPLERPDGEYDVLLHGHNHRTVVERDGDSLTFNPGECAGHMTGLNTVGILDLNDLAISLQKF